MSPLLRVSASTTSQVVRSYLLEPCQLVVGVGHRAKQHRMHLTASYNPVDRHARHHLVV